MPSSGTMGVELDERKLSLMKVAILQAERRNVNTREKTKGEMVDLLKSAIVTYADKSF